MSTLKLRRHVVSEAGLRMLCTWGVVCGTVLLCGFRTAPSEEEFAGLAAACKIDFEVEKCGAESESSAAGAAFVENTGEKKSRGGAAASKSEQAASDNEDAGHRGILESIEDDYRHFYSRDRLTRMGLVFGAGAVVANTNLDDCMQTRYHRDGGGSGTRDLSAVAKEFGEGKYLIPATLLAASIRHWDETSAVAEWGERSARAYLTGGPAMLFMQAATGASRPDERENASRWRPFRDNNGVSGHAFMGAVPFLTVGEMAEENRLLKYAAYAASTATAWSRVNDDAHFFSQAALGWYMAWEAVRAVSQTESDRERQVAVVPFVYRDAVGIGVWREW